VSQGSRLADADVRRLFSEAMGEIYNDDFPVLSYVGFQTIMGHHKNDAYDPIACLHASRDMDAPLHHYHISCSDGSAEDIATKDRGDSSLLEPEHRPNCYAAAVRQGVRALELRCFEERVNSASSITDLYVGSSKDRQRVNFKGTASLPHLCMNLIFSYLLIPETLIAISAVAFTTDSTPLILMLEIACSLAQQKRASKLLKKIFRSALVTPAEIGDTLPSPSDLCNKVVLFLTHRKKDITTAYRLDRTLDRLETAPSFDSPDPSALKTQRSLEWSPSTDVMQNDPDWDAEFALRAPLDTISASQYATTPPRVTYIAVDVESGKLNGSLDNLPEDHLHSCQPIHSSLMSLCNYSRGLQINSHSLSSLLERFAEDPSSEDALIAFNRKRMR
jgi:hypothetical protein